MNQPFSIENEFSFSLRLDSGPAAVVVRVPTNEDSARHAALCRTIFQNHGRRQSETPVDSAKAAHALYYAVRVDGAPDLDAVMAKRFIGLLGAFEIRDGRLEGDDCPMEAMIRPQAVAIRLKAPTTKSVLDYRMRAFQLISLPHRPTPMISRLGEAAVLFDRCFVSAEGYRRLPRTHPDPPRRPGLAGQDRLYRDGARWQRGFLAAGQLPDSPTPRFVFRMMFRLDTRCPGTRMGQGRRTVRPRAWNVRSPISTTCSILGESP